MNANPSVKGLLASVPVLPNLLVWRGNREVVNGKLSQRPTIYAATQVNFVTHSSSIREKNFRPLLWLARLLGWSSSKRAFGCESGENFGFDHCLLNPAGTPHFKDAT